MCKTFKRLYISTYFFKWLNLKTDLYFWSPKMFYFCYINSLADLTEKQTKAAIQRFAVVEKDWCLIKSFSLSMCVPMTPIYLGFPTDCSDLYIFFTLFLCDRDLDRVVYLQISPPCLMDVLLLLLTLHVSLYQKIIYIFIPGACI